MDKQGKKRRKYGTWGLLLLLLLAAVAVSFLGETVRVPTHETVLPQMPTSGTEETICEAEDTRPEQFRGEIDLGEGLILSETGNYSGIYMEDGSNETVMDVMMLVLTNSAGQDLQYAKIELVWGEQVLLFEATNLRSGSRAVLLEKNRTSLPEGEPDSAELKQVVFFEESMELLEDVLQISGAEGVLNVRNISDSGITGDIYIYYKYSAGDIYYGGITFRAKVPGGLGAGEIYQIPTGHYAPTNCAIVQVTAYG